MILYDVREIEKFLNFYPNLMGDEVLFLSLSSRAKYLIQQQRDHGIRINRNEMFHRRWFTGTKVDLVQKTLTYLTQIKIGKDIELREEVLKDFTTASGHNIPVSTVTVYVNINPSSMRKAAANLSSEVIKKLMSKDDDWFTHLQSKLNTEVQKAKSRRELIDIDFDVPYIDPVKWVQFHAGGEIIQTHGGYHLIIPKAKLEGCNLGGIIQEAKNKFSYDEIIINSNAMVPLPGTYSGGKEIRFVE